MLKIQNSKKPSIKITKMKCDNVIDEKLLKYPFTKDAFSHTNFTIICGMMGQGKTSLITSFMNSKDIFQKTFHDVFLVMPENSRMSIENDIFGKYLPDENIHTDLNVSVLEDIYERCLENSKECYNSILIIDDYQEALKNPDIVERMQKFITKMRHIHCSIILLQQSFKALNKQLRMLATNIITYDLGKEALYNMFDEILAIKKKNYDEFIKYMFEEPHDWILISRKYNRVYKKFDLITFL